MDIVLSEARKRDMKIWILDDKHFPTGYANGLIEQHPERKKQYIACTTVDIYGASRPLSLNIQRMLKPTIGFWEIGNPVDYAEQAKNTLVTAVALRYEEGCVFHEDVVDLTDLCRDGKVTFKLKHGMNRAFKDCHISFDCKVLIRFYLHYSDHKDALDPDNVYIKPILDEIAMRFLRDDGPEQVSVMIDGCVDGRNLVEVSVIPGQIPALLSGSPG